MEVGPWYMLPFLATEIKCTGREYVLLEWFFKMNKLCTAEFLNSDC
jgi:hypothetical protein